MAGFIIRNNEGNFVEANRCDCSKFKMIGNGITVPPSEVDHFGQIREETDRGLKELADALLSRTTELGAF